MRDRTAARRRIEKRGGKVLAPVRPNAGITVAYRKRILCLVDEMHDSFGYWIKAAYRANEPVLAQDASPAATLQKAMRSLGRRWQRNFNEAAPKLARYFARSMSRRSEAVLKGILRDAGITVQFKMTAAMNDVLQATMAENVSLIRSIPQQYLTQVEGLVMRSVQTGRDLGTLTKELEQRYGLTRKRAAFIAKDQNNKATAALTRVRQEEAGIKQAIWVHSHAGKVPRPTHLANDGEPYDVTRGWFDPDPKVRKRIWPGELINCFPGSTRVQFANEVEKAYRRWYRGDLTTLITDTGKTLQGTPNHPVLTPRGWVAIDQLHEGEYVVEVADHRAQPVVAEGDEDHIVPLIGEIFETLRKTGRSKSEVALRDQFHGDGGTDGHVDVVFSARTLSFGWEASKLQSFDEHFFPQSAQLVFRRGSTKQLVLRHLRAAASFVRSLGEAFAPFDAFAIHPDAVGGASASNLAAGGDDPWNDHHPFDAVHARQFEDTHPRLMLPTKLARLIHVDRSSFEGHVFNLQTGSGWYLAEGIIVHNCRCFSRAVVKGFS